MYWWILLLAGILEVGWAVGLKYSENFSKLVPSIITVALMIVSMWLLSVSVKHLPVGTAYAVWTGIGAVGTAILGMVLFNESKDFIRIFFILLIVTGIAGLKIFSGEAK
ncbi:MAG: quaternary ammonium compound efflux SMR transporter SugE [Ignavibacteriaceae bacterium]|nr:quaternary ammonium compound efflux SMR transporter SugE [Ignavibacteriaceae bacterium]